MISNGPANRSIEPTRIGPFAKWWDRAAIIAARSLVLFAIVYACWRFGAVETGTLRDLLVLLSAATGLVTLAPSVWARRRPMPGVLFACGLALVAYGWIQSTPIPNLAEQFGFNQTRYADDQVSLLKDTVDRFGATPSLETIASCGSVVAEETRQAIVPLILGLMIMLVSSLAFRTPSSRKVYLSVLVLHALILSIWGILQRANGNQQILPGIDFQTSGVPFASFVYKNAGAAVLLPALAIIAAVLVVRERPESRIYQDGVGGKVLSAGGLTLFCSGAVITTGLIASLSRGAWLAACLALLIIAVVQQVTRSRRLHWGVIGGMAIAIVSLIVVAGLHGQILDGATRFSFETIRQDQRWQHWPDGLRTAAAHLPFGSGLGTYGYATLPYQAAAHGAWFRHAHNQYLETLVETGIPGLLAVATGFVVLAMMARRLVRQGQDLEKQRWGWIASVALICCAVQSGLDFVLVVPAVLLLYASLFGVVGQLAAESTAANGPRTKLPSRQLLPGRMSLAVCLFCVFVSGLWALRTTSNQLVGDRALASTRLSLLDDTPTRPFVETQIRLLDDAIGRQPERSALHARRAHWRFAAYRLSVLQAGIASSVDVPWPNTQTQSLFHALTLSSNEDRKSLRDELLATGERQLQLAGVLAGFSQSLQCNPLHPQTHLECAYLSPLTQMPTECWTRSAGPLIKNSHSMLFTNGLIACYTGDLDYAIDQWQQSLSISHAHIEPIFRLSQERLPPQRVVAEIVPQQRPDMLVRLLQDAAADDVTSVPIAADQIIEHLETTLRDRHSTERETALRHATIARIHRLAGRDREAAKSWRRAVAADGRNLDYRWCYADALQALGQLNEALNQTTLGQAIRRDDQRFNKLAVQIRQQIRHADDTNRTITRSLDQ